MGTSRTNDGPGDRTPLLPAWALPGGAPPASPDVPAAEEDTGGDGTPEEGAGDNGDPDDAPHGADDADRPDVSPNPQAQPPPARWQAAKRRLTQSARAGGGRANVSAAGRAYVRAKGGSRAAASAATQGRATAARVGGFFGAILSGGLGAALDALGLRNYIGRAAEVVFAAIANAITPPGSTLEGASARRAADEVLAKFYDAVIEADGDLGVLEAMSEEGVADAVRGVITAYVYERWLEQLGKSIESGAVTAAEAVRLEREVKQYVRDIVVLDVTNDDVLAFGRDAHRTQEVIGRLFEEAYSLLENGR